MPRPSRKPRTISRWENLVAYLTPPDELERFRRCRTGRHRFLFEAHYPLGLTIISRRAGLLQAACSLSFAILLGLLFGTMIRPHMFEPLLPKRTISSVVCLFILATTPLFVRAARASLFPSLSLLSLRRTLPAEAIRAGRRSNERTADIVSAQSGYAPAWRAFHAAKRNNIVPLGRLLDSSSQMYLLCGMVLLSQSSDTGKALELALGISGIGLVVPLTGLAMLVWGLSLRPAANTLRRLLDRHAAHRCPECDYDLTGTRPALPAAPNLGPETCPECGIPWPLVLPAPPWPPSTDITPRQVLVPRLRKPINPS